MSKKFKISEEKKIIVNTLKDFFIDRNFQCINTWELSYDITKIIDNGTLYKGAFVFSNYSPPAFGNWIIIVPVEKLIQEIQYPNHDFSVDNGYHETINNIYPNKNISINNFEGKFETEDDYVQFAELIKHYIKTEGQKFIDTYRYLPNVLTEMDKLETQGKYWNGGPRGVGILCGLGDAFFRGLIISKLCDDKNFKAKIIMVDEIFSKSLKWQPYYEKLKTRLETLEPLYSMDSDGIYQPIPQPISPKTTTIEASSNLEIDNKTDMINSDLIPETVIEIERFDAVHLEKLNNFLSNIHKHTIEASQARDDDMLNREELLYFQEIHRDQINKAIGDTPIHKAMKLERIEIFPNNTNEFAIYYYALDLGTFTTLAVNVTLSPEGWVEDSRMIVD